MQKLVTISPGHDIWCPGAVYNEFKEHIMATELSNLVACHINKSWSNKLYAITVSASDIGFEHKIIGRDKYKERFKLKINRINKINPDLAIEIHFNSYRLNTAKGFEVWYYINSVHGRKYAQIFCNNLEYIGTLNRGIKPGRLYFLRKTNPIAILIEVAFINNFEDMGHYQVNKLKYAFFIAKAIRDSLCI